MSEQINFDLLNVPVPELVKTYSLEKQREIFDYLNGLDELNKKGYSIAFDHLDSSFDICRSNGFKKWQISQKSK